MLITVLTRSHVPLSFFELKPGDPRFCKNPLKPDMKCGVFDAAALRVDRYRQRKEGRAFYARNREISGFKGGDDKMEDYTIREYMKRRFKDVMDKKKKKNHADGMRDVTHDRMEKVMLQVAYNNPQCLFLARGERTFGDEYEAKRLREMDMRRTECQAVYMSLQRTMDWVGRTDRLSDETLPLLTHIMFQNPQMGKLLPKANVSPTSGFVKMSQIQPSTRKELERRSQFDQEIYYRVIEDYSMDQWENNTDYAAL
jgi:hypothetical protein